MLIIEEMYSNLIYELHFYLLYIKKLIDDTNEHYLSVPSICSRAEYSLYHKSVVIWLEATRNNS